MTLLGEDRRRQARESAEKKARVLITDIAKSLRDKGHKVEVGKVSSFRDALEISEIDGVFLHVGTTIERTGGTWHSHASGKVRVKIVGNVGDTKQFPERKEGHDVERLVGFILERFGHEKARQDERDAKQSRRTASESLARSLNQEFALGDFALGEFSTLAVCGTDHGGLCFEGLAVTEEQARAILTIMTKGA
jgi:hypothetical protein